MEIETLRSFGLTLALGILVGLQRERSSSTPGGVRTFSLIALLGWVAGYLSLNVSPFILPATLLVLGTVLFAGNLSRIQKTIQGRGITTEIASLLVFLAAVLFPSGETTIGVMVFGVAALLLHYKESLHGFVRGLSKNDVQAIMQFALLSLIILPNVPNRTFDPYDVLNPFEIWMMVVLIVGIGLTGYILYRILGGNTGTIAAGILGGAVSSTATTISSARISKKNIDHANASALIIILATAVSLLRMAIEIAFVTRESAWDVLPPILVIFAVTVILSTIFYRFKTVDIASLPPPENPSQLKPALIFGILYGVILLAVAMVKEKVGDTGLYGVSILSGLTDLDAITLSTSQMFSNGRIDAGLSRQLIVLAFISNLLFKGGAVVVLGGKRLIQLVLIGYGVLIIVGGLILLFWK